MNPWVLFVAACAWVLDRLWGEKASTRRYVRKWRKHQPQDPPGFRAIARREDGCW